MKNNRGFTLIELLAIIVRLAIIAFITVPRIMDFTASARKGAAKTSAMDYVDAFEKTSLKNFVDRNGNLSSASELIDVEYIADMVEVNGKVPTDGWIHIDNGSVEAYSLVIDNAYVVTARSMNVEPTVESGSEPAAQPEGFPPKPTGPATYN